MKSLRARLRPRRAENGDQGFTLVEMVVAIGLIGIVFAATAAIMTSSLRALSVQKARTQGNEVATQAIEDLQRRTFDGLAMCSSAEGTPPAGLELPVQAPACPDPLPDGYGEDPCNGTNAGQAPKAQYSCTRVGVTYTVKRYIAWVDAAQTNKRLAVFVTWTDSAGPHEVSQQSSLRAPSSQSIIGLLNPTLTSGTATASVLIDAAGGLAGSISFSVNATDLLPDDSVFANLYNVDEEGNLEVKTVELSSSLGAQWNGVVAAGTAGFRFAEGTQVVYFNALRQKDGKAAATVAQAPTTFCKTSPCTAPNLIPNPPTKSPAGTVGLNATGGLLADFSVSVGTDNIPANGQVQLLLPTLGGMETINMLPSSGCGTTSSSCTWTATVPKSAGHAFSKTSTLLYVVAAQPYVVGSTDPSQQGTTDSESVSVSFG